MRGLPISAYEGLRLLITSAAAILHRRMPRNGDFRTLPPSASNCDCCPFRRLPVRPYHDPARRRQSAGLSQAGRGSQESFELPQELQGSAKMTYVYRRSLTHPKKQQLRDKPSCYSLAKVTTMALRNSVGALSFVTAAAPLYAPAQRSAGQNVGNRVGSQFSNPASAHRAPGRRC